MRRNKNVKRRNWEDAYYDGILSPHDDYCEETQRIVSNKKLDDGWDRYEDLEEDDIEWDD